MVLPPAQSAPDIPARLRMILAGLRSVMGLLGLDGQIALLVSKRSGQIFGRIERMLLRFRAGKLRFGMHREGGQKRSRPSAGRGPALPRKFGWLLIAGKHHAAYFHIQLQDVLSTPDMAEFLAAAPQA